MGGLLCTTALLLTVFSPLCLGKPMTARPGTVDDIIITKYNTINGTAASDFMTAATEAHPLSISITNNMDANTSLTAYITGRDVNGAVVLLSSSGGWYYPDPNGSKTPVKVTADVALPLGRDGVTTNFTLPDYITAGRIWVSDGDLNFYVVASGGTQLVEPSYANPSDPSAGTSWGFVELSYNAQGIYADISFVDFVSLVMGISLHLETGEVQTVKGLRAGAVASICKDLEAQTAIDGQPWDEMCVTDAYGTPLRVLAPNIYIGANPGALKDYFADYINRVWTHYKSTNLKIDTQTRRGLVNCRVKGYGLFCHGDNRAYTQPKATDIFGCNSGPFATIDGDNHIHQAIVPRLCAAFNRGTLLEAGGNVQPSLNSSNYYLTSPNNQYSRIVHKYETDGLGYAFSYDDVNPSGENQAGLVSGPNPQLLKIIVGGFS